MRALSWLLISLLLGGCASSKSKFSEFEDVTRLYHQALRWEGAEAIPNFLDPKYDAQSNQQRYERLQQFQIKGVRPLSAPVLDEKAGTASQQVALELVNRHTSASKTIVDVQRWRYENKRWLLSSGFPDLDKELAD
jgi:hypothetical protein